MTKGMIQALSAIVGAIALAHLSYGGSARDATARPEYGVQPWEHVGDQIHRSTVEGFQLSYHLLQKDEAQELRRRNGISAGDRPSEETGSHHLMLFIMAPDGTMRTADVEVTFAVAGPAGIEQEAGAKPMMGGFGADLSLRPEGEYRIESTIITRGKTLVDSFAHAME